MRHLGPVCLALCRESFAEMATGILLPRACEQRCTELGTRPVARSEPSHRGRERHQMPQFQTPRYLAGSGLAFPIPPSSSVSPKSRLPLPTAAATAGSWPCCLGVCRPSRPMRRDRRPDFSVRRPRRRRPVQAQVASLRRGGAHALTVLGPGYRRCHLCLCVRARLGLGFRHRLISDEFLHQAIHWRKIRG